MTDGMLAEVGTLLFYSGVALIGVNLILVLFTVFGRRGTVFIKPMFVATGIWLLFGVFLFSFEATAMFGLLSSVGVADPMILFSGYFSVFSTLTYTLFVALVSFIILGLLSLVRVFCFK